MNFPPKVILLVVKIILPSRSLNILLLMKKEFSFFIIYNLFVFACKLRPDGDSSVGLKPVEVLGDSGEGSGVAGLAAERRAEGDNADFGDLAVSLGDDQGAAGVSVAGGDGSSIGVHAQLVGVDDEVAVEVCALSVGDDGEVDELHIGADGGGG